MSTMIKEVYEAFKDAGTSEEKAASAAEAIADYESKFANIEPDLRLIKWMLGLIVAIDVLPLLKALVT